MHLSEGVRPGVPEDMRAGLIRALRSLERLVALGLAGGLEADLESRNIRFFLTASLHSPQDILQPIQQEKDAAATSAAAKAGVAG